MLENQIKQQKPQQFSQLDNTNQKLQPQTEQISDKFIDYQDYFKQFEHIIQKEYFKPMQQSQISIHFDTFSPFQIKILSSSLSQQITEAEIKWGYYTIKIAILNSDRISCFHCCRFASGSYGKIYFYDREQAQSFVVKCNIIDRQSVECIYQSKIFAFKEYFITKIASSLGCGPYLQKYMGFDLIFSQNCIQFAMQECSKPNKFNQKTFEQLKQNLFNLHQSGIIHFDIKPQNIMWSNHFKRLIFIDYGLSQINNGKKGYKQYVYFKGSLQYCSKQMSALFQSKLKEAIDIHYNDAYSLKQSIKWLRSKNKDHNQHQNIFYQQSQDQSLMIYEEKISIDLKNRYLIILLKYYIYKQDHNQILNIYNNIEDKASIFEGEILNFIKEEYSPKFLFDFFKKYVSSDINGSVQFGWLQQWSKSIFSKFNIQQQLNSGNKQTYQSYYHNLCIIDKIQPQNLIYLNLSELQAMLFTQSISDQQYYFYVFVTYISFTNNIHRIGIDKKLKACQYFISKLINTEQVNNVEENQSQLNLLYSSLRKIFHYILDFYIHSKDLSSNSIKILQRLDLCLQIIEQSILICLFSTEQFLSLLEQFYQASLWRQQDRLQIVFRINYYLIWNKFPLIPLRMYDNLKWLQWIEKKSIILMDSLNQTYLKLVWQLQSELLQKISWQNTDNTKFFQPFTKTLKLNTWIHRIKQSIRGDPHHLFSALQILQKIIPNKMKSKIFPFYHDLIGFTLQLTKNTQQAWKFCQKIKININSKQMLQNYLPILILKSMQTQDRIKIMECLTVLFTILTPTNYFHLSFIINSLIEQLTKKTSLNQTKTSIKTHEINSRMISVIQQVINRFHYRNNRYSKFHGSGYTQYNYFTLRIIFRDQFGIHYHEFKDETTQFQESVNLQQCQYCLFRKKYVVLLLKKSQIQHIESDMYIQKLIQNHVQLLEHVLSPSSLDYNQVQLLNYKISTYSLFVKSLCIKRIMNLPQFDDAINELYRLLKKQQKMSYYIYITHQNRAMIALTLNQILNNYGIDEVIQFILKIVSAEKYLETTQYIFCITNNFRTFNQLLFNQNIYLAFLILQKLQQFQKQQPYIMLYYFGFVQTSHLLCSMKRYLYKTLKLLEYLPAKMYLFMSIQLYELILFQQPKLIPYISVFNNNCEEEFNRKLDRKTIYLMSKMTKLIHYFNGVEVEAKKNRTKCKKRKKLYQKCNNVKSTKIWIPHEIILSLKLKSTRKKQKRNTT